jgi:hypothetical protein
MTGCKGGEALCKSKTKRKTVSQATDPHCATALQLGKEL